MWTKEQQLAIDKENSNILVSASAGSGKTAVLVERVITKVIKNKIDIDKILVVTFTNAAAVELKERLMLAIYKALNENPQDKFLKRQLTYINRASITTIHSFCLKLIRSNFEFLNIDPNFKICDEIESNILKARAISNVLEKEYIESNKNNEKSQKLYNLLELFGGKDENLTEYILKIYSYIQSFAYPFEWLDNAIKKYNITECEDLSKTDFGKYIYDNAMQNLNLILKRGEEVLELLRGNEDFTKYVLLLEEELSYITNTLNNAKNWDGLYELLNTIQFGRAPVYKGDNINLKNIVTSYRNDILKKGIESLKKSVYEKTSKILKDQQKAYNYIIYLYEFLVKFSNEYEKLKQEKNYIDFNDIEHLSLKLLVDKKDDKSIVYTEVAQNLQEKFSEVYTDEYQDISFIQEEILKSVSNNNNRFMVGDIKQSIYRFRQAMPDIFNKKYLDYTNIENKEQETKDAKIILAKNFRSRKEVLYSINYIFEQLMSNELGDCDYSNLETLKYGANLYDNENNLNYKTEINIIESKKEENNSEESDENDEVLEYINELKKFEIEAICIAKKINEIVKNYKTYNIKQGTLENVKYKDIVILLRSIKDKGNILEETLRKFNIPAFCDTSTNLFESEEVYLLLSLLKILDNPYQDIYMISVMYSIIGKFSLDELVYIRNIDKYSRVYDNINALKVIIESKDEKSNFEEELNKKITKFLEVFKILQNYSKTNSISNLIIKIYDETNIYRQYLLDNNASQRRANLNLLIDIAKKCEEQSILTLSEYVNYVKNLKDKTDASSSSAKIIGENEDVVRIMTIHKSKGLEFPFVILCDTMKKYNMLDTSATVTMHHELGIGVNVVNEEYKITYPSVIKQSIKDKIITETKSEELRMLYVALTRAKEKLYIYASVKDYEKMNSLKHAIYDENGKIISLAVKSNNTYFENINIALKKEDHLDYFDINIINPIEEINIDSLDSKKENKSIISSYNEKIKYKQEEIDEEIKKIKESLDYNYKFEEFVTVPSRVSVSSLKKEYMEENNVVEMSFIDDVKLEEKYRKPQTFNDTSEEVYTQARKGTLIHFILENLDMKKLYTYATLKEYIETLLFDGIITRNDVKYININKIIKFLNSSLGNNIRESNIVQKEQEFILSDENISKSIIQGIIDLYYINENGNIVLIDFKTDRLKEDIEYIDRYKKQLEIYKIALEKLLNKKVENTYIYSFYLDKEIEVK